MMSIISLVITGSVSLEEKSAAPAFCKGLHSAWSWISLAFPSFYDVVMRAGTQHHLKSSRQMQICAATVHTMVRDSRGRTKTCSIAKRGSNMMDRMQSALNTTKKDYRKLFEVNILDPEPNGQPARDFGLQLASARPLPPGLLPPPTLHV